MSTMRAKMQVSKVTPSGTPVTQEQVEFFAVTSKPFDENGENDDNTFARYTPGGNLSLCIANPALLGKFKAGQKFYLDFIEAAE